MDYKHLDREQLRERAAEHGLEYLVDECADADLDDIEEMLEQLDADEACANEADGGYGECTESPRIC